MVPRILFLLSVILSITPRSIHCITSNAASTVNVRIDNLRPTGTGKLFTEEDFLDPEASGDGEWDGDSSDDAD